jgi:hypothetical protein
MSLPNETPAERAARIRARIASLPHVALVAALAPTHGTPQSEPRERSGMVTGRTDRRIRVAMDGPSSRPWVGSQRAPHATVHAVREVARMLAAPVADGRPLTRAEKRAARSRRRAARHRNLHPGGDT